ncbi:SHOCT-like domain-containing protein [Thermogemmatispora carboxidivorans]|uniref:SHOCT-like domain-containing protein n=1 Tax=Thermogemmatispora carboxidivorans TaxID=1382306 RepID=UPI00069A01EB|nr:hypothetical protein [Thermogemmatispora carboxidivorans]
MRQTVSVGPQPRIRVGRISGDLVVRPGELQRVLIESDRALETELGREGQESLMLSDCRGDLTLWLPADAALSVSWLAGDGDIQGIRLCELEEARADLAVKRLSEALILGRVAGDLRVQEVPLVRARGEIGEGQAKDVERLEMSSVSGDLVVEGGSTVLLGSVGGDLRLPAVASSLRCGRVGGDALVQGGADTKVVLGQIGGDLELLGAAQVYIGGIEGDAVLRDISGEVEIGRISGDFDCREVMGQVRVSQVMADAVLKKIHASLEMGAVDGDLSLQADFPPDSFTRLNVSGDAVLSLPAQANLTLRAVVGGSVSGAGLGQEQGETRLLSLVYGSGEAQVELRVGGDLRLQGGDHPRADEGPWRSWLWSWEDFEQEMRAFGRTMTTLGQELAREMTRLAQDLARELAGAGVESSARWSEEVLRMLEEQARRAQERAAAWERRFARFRPQGGGPRVRLRFQEHEWQMDPERLYRMLDQAQRAAAEGVAGAMEAVERALRNLGLASSTEERWRASSTSSSGSKEGTDMPPMRSATPASRTESPEPAPSAEQPGSQPAEQPPAEQPPAEQSQSDAETSPDLAAAAAVEREREREAILRMIAEGRLSPEEGDMLLEALGA